MELKDVKLKFVEELTPEEVTFLNEHRNELDDDDRAAYSSVLDPIEEDTPPETPEETPPADDTVSFKSQAELDAYLEQKLQEQERKLEEKLKPPPAEDTQEKPLFSGGDRPRDWSEVLQKVEEVVESRDAKKAEAARQLQERVEAINNEFVKLADNGKLPAKDSEDFIKARDQILDIGSKNGKVSVQDAYDLWRIIPVEHGGGLVVQTPEAKAEADRKTKEQKMKAQKKAAGQVGGSAGSAQAASGTGFDYQRDHGKSLDDLMEDIWTKLD